MNDRTIAIPTIPGTPFENGIYAGSLLVNNAEHAIILPPKAIAEHAPTPWNGSNKRVEGALSFCDGLANTQAMAQAGSKLAQWALDNNMHLPSLDELELIYRFFKPGIAKNDCWNRSGINVSAIPPTYPYTPELPTQTDIADYRAGGAEAFEEDWYWSSTQYASGAGSAWYQSFYYGDQYDDLKGSELRARAVRRLKL